MNPIVFAVIIVAAIGLLLGLMLAVASIIMAVPVDEKAAAIEEVLAGANCGACGFSGCSGYASALSKGTCTDCTLCSPGGQDTIDAISKIMGVASVESVPQTAIVLCNGTRENAIQVMEYAGVHSCKAATQLYGGGKACPYGCLGYGDCVSVCPYDAIHINDGGIAEVDSLKCKSCKKCIHACPKGIIDLVPLYRQEAVVRCKSHEKGGLVRKECKVGCIGCMKCQKVCQHDAIHVKDFVAYVDQTKCIGCGDCVKGCPSHCIELNTYGQVIFVDSPAVKEAVGQ